MSCAASGQQLERESGGERPKMPAIGGRHTRDPDRLGERGDRRIDETERQVLESATEIRHPRISAVRQIDNQIRAFHDAGIEGLPAFAAQPDTEKMIDFSA
jgi:hypothetical protein